MDNAVEISEGRDGRVVLHTKRHWSALLLFGVIAPVAALVQAILIFVFGYFVFRVGFQRPGFLAVVGLFTLVASLLLLFVDRLLILLLFHGLPVEYVVERPSNEECRFRWQVGRIAPPWRYCSLPARIVMSPFFVVYRIYRAYGYSIYVTPQAPDAGSPLRIPRGSFSFIVPRFFDRPLLGPIMEFLSRREATEAGEAMAEKIETLLAPTAEPKAEDGTHHSPPPPPPTDLQIARPAPGGGPLEWAGRRVTVEVNLPTDNDIHMRTHVRIEAHPVSPGQGPRAWDLNLRLLNGNPWIEVVEHAVIPVAEEVLLVKVDAEHLRGGSRHDFVFCISPEGQELWSKLWRIEDEAALRTDGLVLLTTEGREITAHLLDPGSGERRAVAKVTVPDDLWQTYTSALPSVYVRATLHVENGQLHVRGHLWCGNVEHTSFTHPLRFS